MSETNNSSADIAAWLEAHPDIEVLHTALCDLNGIMRGKRIPIEQAPRVIEDGIRMPLSVVGLDVWGEDIVGNPLVYSDGDEDGICKTTGRGALPNNWNARPSAMIPLWFFRDAVTPYLADPRQSLAAILRRYAEIGLEPVVATELEFYLVDPDADSAVPPISPYTGKRLDSDALMSVEELEDFGEFFRDVYQHCKDQSVLADTAIAENGIGQFEINLLHTNALKAADDAVLFKRIVKGVARKHKMVATFMAKPYGERSGNGFHVHFSLNDSSGKNIFDDGSDSGSEELTHAVGGLLKGMAETTLLFAPHLNSYRRLRPDTHAPSSISWGYENRTTALRIPAGSSSARRIEHRVSGADANPYLVIAGILGAALVGLEDQLKPPPPFSGSAYTERLPKLPADWASAVNAFEDGDMVRRILDKELQSLLVACKRQEIAGFADQVTDLEFSAYLEAI